MRRKRTTLHELAESLRAGGTTSVELVEGCLDRIRSGGEAVFTGVDSERALADARAWDMRRNQGQIPTPFAGIPFSAKDLFDVAGEVTTAGSVVLQNTAAAERDAEAVGRMRRAGFVLLGRTNMTEFAYSGLGLNPHFGTPWNVADKTAKRIPGGSSSGAAVAVGEALSFVALGTDTGGSCRIPAGLNGVVGYKPTARRVSRQGLVPLSTSLDTVGPIGASVGCCKAVFDLLNVGGGDKREERREGEVRLLLPLNYVQDDLDGTTAERFAFAIQTLRARGVRVTERRVEAFAMLPALTHQGGIAGYEAFQSHAARLADEARREAYDPLVLARILRGGEMSAAKYEALLQRRTQFIAAMAEEMEGFDALVMPTTPEVAPLVRALEHDVERYTATNLRMLRNTAIINLLDGCSISLPIPSACEGELPVGLMLASLGDGDDALLELAERMEAWLDSDA